MAAKTLPYTVETATGDSFRIDFPLHAETGSGVRVNQMLTAILAALDRDIRLGGEETSNGDVLQALAMALAVRARMIHAPSEVTDELALDLLRRALHAAKAAERGGAEPGHG